MLKIRQGVVTTQVEVAHFPGGEVKVTTSLPMWIDPKTTLTVITNLKTSDDVMALLLTVDAIRRINPDVSINAEIPYIPYARQDRVCNAGEPLSTAVMARLINSCGFSKVVITDPHSDVTPALINNAIVQTKVNVFRDIKTDWSNTWILAPDAGAIKSCYKFADAVRAASVITATKKRNTLNDRIGSVVCDTDIDGKALLVLDDICDGGGTFIYRNFIASVTASPDTVLSPALVTKAMALFT